MIFFKKVQVLSVLNYKPRVSLCPTCLRCLTYECALRVCLPSCLCPLRAFLFLCAMHAFNFLRAFFFTRALCDLIFSEPYVPSFFTCVHFLRTFTFFKCSYFFTCLNFTYVYSVFLYGFIFLRAFIFLVTYMLSYLTVFLFLRTFTFLCACILFKCFRFSYMPSYFLRAFLSGSHFSRSSRVLTFYMLPYVASFFTLKCQIKEGRGPLIVLLFFQFITSHFGLLN